jgi:Coenzyme PQQ synthesis protein D (PqqD)
MVDVLPSEISPDFTPARGDAVFTVELDGEAVLLDEDRNRLHHLNHTATLLWLLFDGEISLDRLADEVSAELAVPKGTVLADALAVARHLAEEGLIGDVAPPQDEKP